MLYKCACIWTYCLQVRWVHTPSVCYRLEWPEPGQPVSCEPALRRYAEMSLCCLLMALYVLPAGDPVPCLQTAHQA